MIRANVQLVGKTIEVRGFPAVLVGCLRYGNS